MKIDREINITLTVPELGEIIREWFLEHQKISITNVNYNAEMRSSGDSPGIVSSNFVLSEIKCKGVDIK